MPLTVDQLLTASPADATGLLLSEPEGQWFDRESARIQPQDLAESLVAMANAEGGILALGFRDGKCEGVNEQITAQNRWRRAGLDFTDPAVKFNVHLVPCINGRGKVDNVFVIEVPSSDQVHENQKGLVFLRVGDANRQLTFEQRLQLGYDRGDTSYESTPIAAADVAALNPERLAAYSSQLGHSAPQRLLSARGLLNSAGVPSAAAILLFGHEPQAFFPAAWVQVVRWAGTERSAGSAQNLATDIRCNPARSSSPDAFRPWLDQAR